MDAWRQAGMHAGSQAGGGGGEGEYHKSLNWRVGLEVREKVITEEYLRKY